MTTHSESLTWTKVCPKGEKVLTIKGTKHVNEVCSSNEKESLTVLLCVSAAGQVGPSLIVYPGQRHPKNIEQFLPNNWSVGKSEKGWITGEVFYEYIANVFHKWLIKNNVPLPVILYVDGHSSHLTLHLSTFAADNGIEIVALHPNATHILQPLTTSGQGLLWGSLCCSSPISSSQAFVHFFVPMRILDPFCNKITFITITVSSLNIYMNEIYQFWFLISYFFRNGS